MWKWGIARDPAAEVTPAARPATTRGCAFLLLPSLHFQLLGPTLQLLFGLGLFILYRIPFRTEVAW